MHEPELLTALDKAWRPVLCVQCEEVVGAKWAVHGNRKYCSNACKQKHWRSTRKVKA